MRRVRFFRSASHFFQLTKRRSSEKDISGDRRLSLVVMIGMRDRFQIGKSGSAGLPIFRAKSIFRRSDASSHLLSGNIRYYLLVSKNPSSSCCPHTCFFLSLDFCSFLLFAASMCARTFTYFICLYFFILYSQSKKSHYVMISTVLRIDTKFDMNIAQIEMIECCVWT